MMPSTLDSSDGKCENILDCQLAILQEGKAKCKQVIQWSGDAGLDMYIPWNLHPEEITLQTIWSNLKIFASHHPTQSMQDLTC